MTVTIDAGMFRRFALYDMLKRQKVWRRPAVFAGIFLASALACLWSGRPQSGMMATVLGGVGLGLPLVYLGTLLRLVNREARAHTPLTRAYTFSESGLTVDGDFIPWERIQSAVRLKDCVCLYVAASRALLIPDNQTADLSAADGQVWEQVRTLRGTPPRPGRS